MLHLDIKEHCWWFCLTIPPLLHLYKQTPTARPSPRRVRWSHTWATGINTPPAFIRLKTLLASLLCSFWSAFWFSRDLEVLFKSRPESRQIKTALWEEFSAFLSIKYKHLRYARQMVQHKTQPLSGLFYCFFFFFSSTQQSIRQINKSWIKDYICENLQRLLQRLLPLPTQTHTMRNMQWFVMPLMDLCDSVIVSCHPVALNIQYFRKGKIYIHCPPKVWKHPRKVGFWTILAWILFNLW